MARKGNFKKHTKGGNKRKRNFHGKSKAPDNRNVAKKNYAKPEVPAKKPKIALKEEQASSESEEEFDPYSNLLSSFNVAQTVNAVETDESDDSELDDDENEEHKEMNAAEHVDEIDNEIEGESDCEIGDESDNEIGEESGSEDDEPNSEGVDEEEGDEEEEEKEEVKHEGDKHKNNSTSKVEDVDEEGDEIEVEPVAIDDVSASDPFVKHLNYDLDECLLETVESSQPSCDVVVEQWPHLGSVKFFLPSSEKKPSLKSLKLISDENVTYAPWGCVPSKISSIDLEKLHIKSQIRGNLTIANSEYIDGQEILTPLQKEIFSIVNNYQDLYFPSRDIDNGEEVRFIYTLHAVNHILKTRTKIVHHNMKIQKIQKNDTPDEYRDQGLVRPKVLIVVPFKDSAYRIIKIIMSLLHPNDKGHVINKSRFLEEYTGGGIAMPSKNPRPEDYEKTFAGNTDDNFKIGLAITRKSVKLYVDFYSADIIVASPLGLRLIIGVEGERERDFDFLASIEVLVLDQVELFLMQNWDHVLHVMNHLHLQPKESHGVDFTRVRSWAINGWTRFYRQTLLFSSVSLPEINSLFNKKCHNYAGKARVEKLYDRGSVCQVILHLSQVFNRFTASGGQAVMDARFDFFTKKILPQFSDTGSSHVLVYVPSYFDYVRIRNYFKKESVSFTQICEYSKDKKIARARDLFFHNEVCFLLYSERAHFFRRFRLKGIRHIIFYQPPTFPRFYSELCNLMAVIGKDQGLAVESHKSVTVLFAKSDALQLAGIVGTDRAARMVSSDRDVYMLVSGV